MEDGNENDLNVLSSSLIGSCRRKAATNASLNISKRQASSFKRVTSLLRKKNANRPLSDEEKGFLLSNTELVKQFYKRREKREEWQLRQSEREDSPKELEEKCFKLAQAIHDAEFLVVYTGAGISTAASIPDYRGPNGIWTRLQKGKDIGNHDLTTAEPTYTHMALSLLHSKGIVRHVVSQNCDGLHLRSGLPKTAISEVHGNMYIEVCKHCVPAREYVRTFDVTEKTTTFKHTTGRRCYRCGEPLVDTIVHFGERGRLRWPLNWQGACQAVKACDTILCLGSSLKVLRKYTWLWQTHRSLKRRPRLYIVNLQWTSKDKDATLKINGKCDDVMRLVMSNMGFEVPKYEKVEDPIFQISTPLHFDELSTINRPPIEPPFEFVVNGFPSPFVGGVGLKNGLVKSGWLSESSNTNSSGGKVVDSSVVRMGEYRQDENVKPFVADEKYAASIRAVNKRRKGKKSDSSKNEKISKTEETDFIKEEKYDKCSFFKDEKSDLNFGFLKNQKSNLKEETLDEKFDHIKDEKFDLVKDGKFELIKDDKFEIFEDKKSVMKYENCRDKSEIAEFIEVENYLTGDEKCKKENAEINDDGNHSLSKLQLRKTETSEIKDEEICNTSNKGNYTKHSVNENKGKEHLANHSDGGRDRNPNLHFDRDHNSVSDPYSSEVALASLDDDICSSEAVALASLEEESESSEKQEDCSALSPSLLKTLGGSDKCDLKNINFYGTGLCIRSTIPPPHHHTSDDDDFDSTSVSSVASDNILKEKHLNGDSHLDMLLASDEDESCDRMTEVTDIQNNCHKNDVITFSQNSDSGLFFDAVNTVIHCDVDIDDSHNCKEYFSFPSDQEMSNMNSEISLSEYSFDLDKDQIMFNAEDFRPRHFSVEVPFYSNLFYDECKGDNSLLLQAKVIDGVIHAADIKDLKGSSEDKGNNNNGVLTYCTEEKTNSGFCEFYPEDVPTNGILNFSDKSSLRMDSEAELKTLWYKQFCATLSTKTKKTRKRKRRSVELEDDVKRLWFWGFDAKLKDKDSNKRLTRSSYQKALLDVEPTESEPVCNCLVANKQFCHLSEPRDEPQELEVEMIQAREAVRKRRQHNYRKYEPVFEVSLKSLTYERGKIRRSRKKKMVIVEEERNDDEEEGLEERKTDDVRIEERKSEDGKTFPSWYGKGYRKIIKKKKNNVI